MGEALTLCGPSLTECLMQLQTPTSVIPCRLLSKHLTFSVDALPCPRCQINLLRPWRHPSSRQAGCHRASAVGRVSFTEALRVNAVLTSSEPFPSTLPRLTPHPDGRRWCLPSRREPTTDQKHPLGRSSWNHCRHCCSNISFGLG